MAALLQVKDSGTSFFTQEGAVKAVKAVDGISFDIDSGEAPGGQRPSGVGCG